MHPIFDVAVIGGGMAGSSVASLLATRGMTTLVLEQSKQPPEHSSGRSVALYSQSYADTAAVSILITASEEFFRHPPEGFASTPLLTSRETVHISGPNDVEALDRLYEQMKPFPAATMMISGRELRQRLPFLRPEYSSRAILEPNSGDLDPLAMWNGYLGVLLRSGGRMVVNAEVRSAIRHHGAWAIDTRAGMFSARTIVNAAGAWADVVASRCGVQPVGLSPLLRTALTAEPLEPVPGDKSDVPFLFAPFNGLYFRTNDDSFTMSPADEVPSLPVDARPKEEDLVRTMRSFESMTTVQLKKDILRRAWAGLRTFAKDRNPVIGFDPMSTGFFWLAGQGGAGIEGAPAMSALAAALIVGQQMPRELHQLGLRLVDVSPQRFVSSARQARRG